jgi:hypothetical protein
VVRVVIDWGTHIVCVDTGHLRNPVVRH